MLDLRIYRAAFIPVIAAIVLMMFSLDPAPEPLEGPVSAPLFEGRSTAREARAIANLAPERKPGSEGDRAVADLVRERFGAVAGGELSEQTFEAEFEGEDVELTNVILTLPGRREEVLLILADRDSPVGQGATSSAAATATLLALASDLDGTSHERTIVLASTAGGSIGSAGARELAEQLPAPAGIEAGIEIANAAVPEPTPPLVIPGRSGPESSSEQLLSTAEEIATVQFERPAVSRSSGSEFARLAFPVGTGAASALDAEGIDGLTISASGERPPSPDADSADAVSQKTAFATGSTALNLLLTLDTNQGGIEQGPSNYVRIGDNLLPGWTVSVLALALVLPALLAAADLLLRERRRDRRVASRALPWALERALLPIAALASAYALAVVGLVPSPELPYDPGRFPPGADGVIAYGLIGLAVAAVALLIRPMQTPMDAEPQTLAAAAGLLSALSVLVIWLLNPFLALLLTPAAHVWILPARAQGPPRTATIAIVSCLALLPALAAAASVASALDLGLEWPWHALILLVGGEIGLLQALAWCGLIGGLISGVAARGAQRPPPETAPRRSVRGPGGHVGPGALGGTPSTLSRR